MVGKEGLLSHLAHKAAFLVEKGVAERERDPSLRPSITRHTSLRHSAYDFFVVRMAELEDHPVVWLYGSNVSIMTCFHFLLLYKFHFAGCRWDLLCNVGYTTQNNSSDEDSLLMPEEAFQQVVPEPVLQSPTSTPSPVMTHDPELDREILLGFKFSFYVRNASAELGWVKRKGRIQLLWPINREEPGEMQTYCIDHAEIDGISVTDELNGIPDRLLKSEVVWSVWVFGSETFHHGRAMRCFFPPGRLDNNSRTNFKAFLKEASQSGNGAGIELHITLEQHEGL